MSLAPSTRTRLWAAAALVLALVIGFNVANNAWALPFAAAALAVACVVGRSSHHAVIGFLLGAAIAGNIVGNRGFAQLYLGASLPILPAEFVLFVAGAILLVRAAMARTMPIPKGGLNAAIVLWIVISAIRLPVDLREFGILAARDFVTVAYSAYFVLGQEAGKFEGSRRFIWNCLTYASLALLLIFPVYSEFPDFFLDVLTVRGDPVIFYKGDLAGTFLAVGCVVYFVRYQQSKRWGWIALALASAAEVIYSHNRASALALLVGAGLFAAVRNFKPLFFLAASGVAASILMVFFLSVTGKSWTETPLFAVYEEAISIADPGGANTYTGKDTENKGDNNTFRMVWWKTILTEVGHDAPLTGKGWGYDLAGPFEQIYYPEGSEEFSARSPHDILITVFARGGAVSLFGFLVVLGAMGLATFRSARAREPLYVYWVIGWMIFTAACFGVVLEGPMGAVIFWTLLGVGYANRMQSAEPESVDEALPAKSEAALSVIK